jgi:hypothetical protein
MNGFLACNLELLGPFGFQFKDSNAFIKRAANKQLAKLRVRPRYARYTAVMSLAVLHYPCVVDMAPNLNFVI